MTWSPDPGMTARQAERELQRVVADFENRVLKGASLPTKCTLEEFCAAYLEQTKPVLSPTTYRNYERIISRQIIPSMGFLKLSDIRPRHVQEFVNALRAEKKRTRSGVMSEEGLSPGSIRKSFAVLQSVLARASRQELIESNPAIAEKIDLPALDEPETQIFTAEEAADMLSCLDNEPLKYQVLIHLAIITGARRGELVALKWEDIDLSGKKINIHRSNYKLTGEEVGTKPPKSRTSRRVVAIPDSMAQMLSRYQTEQRLDRIALGDQWIDRGWVFTTATGEPMNPDTPSVWFAKFLKKYSLPHRKFHALRHTSATLLIHEGIDQKAVSARLGHAQMSTTSRYLHNVQSADRAAADTIGELLSRKEKA